MSSGPSLVVTMSGVASPLAEEMVTFYLCGSHRPLTSLLAMPICIVFFLFSADTELKTFILTLEKLLDQSQIESVVCVFADNLES